jgi:hypothetical protein
MRYFNTLPNLTQTDLNGNSITLKNLLVRTSLIPDLQKNPLLFYEYFLQDGDTPEIVAKKYYGDSYRYWMVLYGNPSIQDPQFDWPLDSNQFMDYLISKYSADAGGDSNVLAYTKTTIYKYQKVITTIDNISQSQSVKTIDIDETTYNSLVESTSISTFSDGSQVTYITSKVALSIYDYENQSNEDKRSIKLINSVYINQMEEQFQSLVSA